MTNKSKIWHFDVFLFCFFHVVCKISNFDMWTSKHLAQASCTEFTLLRVLELGSHTTFLLTRPRLHYRSPKNSFFLGSNEEKLFFFHLSLKRVRWLTLFCKYLLRQLIFKTYNKFHLNFLIATNTVHCTKPIGWTFACWCSLQPSRGTDFDGRQIAAHILISEILGWGKSCRP